MPDDERPFFDASPFATLMFTPDLVMLDCNATHSRMTGLPPEALRGRSMFDVFVKDPDAEGPDTEEVVRASVQRAVETGQPDEAPVQEHGLPRGDGTFEQRFWRMIHSPVTRNGAVVAIRQDSWDVTASVQAQLRQDSLRRMAGSATAIAFWEYDPAADALTRTRELDAIFGFDAAATGPQPDTPPPGTVSLAPYTACVHPGDVERIETMIAEMMAGPLHEVRQLEYRLRRPDGEERKVVVRGETALGAEGRPVLIGTTLDVTDIHANEARLAALLEEKEVLLGEVNHRVKNSMQLVDSLLSMEARRAPDGPGRARFLAAVGRVRAVAAAHASLYHDEDVRTVEFASHLRHFCAHLVEGLGGDTRGIVLDIESEPVTLVAEKAVPLSIIVNELITNAFQHAFGGPDGAPAGASVGVTFGAAPGGYALAVSDNGAALGGAQGTEGDVATSSITEAVLGHDDLLAERADLGREAERVGEPFVASSMPIGTGLRLVETLARQIGATVTRSHDDGWHTRIEFPA